MSVGWWVKAWNMKASLVLLSVMEVNKLVMVFRRELWQYSEREALVKTGFYELVSVGKVLQIRECRCVWCWVMIDVSAVWVAAVRGRASGREGQRSSTGTTDGRLGPTVATPSSRPLGKASSRSPRPLKAPRLLTPCPWPLSPPPCPHMPHTHPSKMGPRHKVSYCSLQIKGVKFSFQVKLILSGCVRLFG